MPSMPLKRSHTSALKGHMAALTAMQTLPLVGRHCIAITFISSALWNISDIAAFLRYLMPPRFPAVPFILLSYPSST